MKLLAAAAFLAMALAAPRAGHAQVWNEETKTYDYVDDKGNVQGSSPASDKPADKPADPAADKPAGEAAGGDAKYGTFALDSSGNKVTGDALSKLPPEAQWAMKEKGYSPVLGPNGEVLGYDNGMMCILPDAVGKDYAAAAEKAKLGPGVQGPCPPSFPNCHSQEPAQPPPPTETAASVAGMIPAEPGKNHCDQPGPPPPCAPDPKKDSAEAKAERERQEADQAVADTTQKGDVNALADALDRRNKAQSDANKTAYNFGDQGGGLGTPGTQDADSGPGSGPIGMSGGQGLGQSGRIGGDSGSKGGGGLAGREVTPDSRALAQSLIDMNKGMANGPADGPSDPNVASVAQLSQRGLGGRAIDAARSLFSTLSENLGVAADSPETDLTDQLATNPIDGAAANRAPIKVVECKKDTLDGAAGGRTSRKIGGC